MNNTSKNFYTYFETMDSNRKILLLIMGAILLFAIFYWAYTVNRNRLEKLKNQVLIADTYEVKNTKSNNIALLRSMNNAFSLSFWLNVKTMTPTSTTGMNTLLNMVNYLRVGIDSTINNLVLQFTPPIGVSADKQRVVLENIPFYTWNHYVITVNGRYVSIYVNGELVKSSLLGAIPTIPTGTSYTLNIGDSMSDASFNATLSNCYYFNNILDYKNIITLVNLLPTKK
jgi:hypothetical protein